MFSPRSPWMSYWTRSNGTMPSKSYWMPVTWATKVYPQPLSNSSKSTSSSMKTSKSQHVHPSKITPGVPVFFIKQKDGSLCLVKDLLKAQCDDSEECLPPPFWSQTSSTRSPKRKPSISQSWMSAGIQTMCRSKRGDEWKAAFLDKLRPLWTPGHVLQPN